MSDIMTADEIIAAGAERHDWFAKFREALATVPESQRAGVEEFRAEAAGYVWGWQDGNPANRTPGDSAHSLYFGYAYGIYHAEYVTGKRGSRAAIRDAWRWFRETGEIRDPWDKK